MKRTTSRRGDAPLSPRISPDLPKRIHIKTATRTFSSHFYYALEDGRIWLRPNPETTGIEEPWCLLGLGGLPTNDGRSGTFEDAVRMEAIVADADELIGLSDAKHFYLIRFDNLGAMGTDLWRDGDGAPGGPLLLDARHRRNRGFTVGRRNQDVLYWEDSVSNPHHWGKEGITTLYLLSEDGREITIFDTGLQPNWGRHIPSPERGSYVAEAISASASTVFLIDRKGRMYTRLADFDVLGANPMFFNYSFTAEHRPADKGSDPASMYSEIKMPAEEWQLQPEISLSGSAALTRDITILQTGQGNRARELRVAGTDSTGRSGYYKKPISQESWTFVETGEGVVADRFLRTISPALPSAEPLPTMEGVYRGWMTVASERLEAELTEFNLFASPARLRISSGRQRLEMALHTIDAWTYATREDPGRDGTPLVFLASIGPVEAHHETLTGALAELDRALRPRYLKPFAFYVRATENYVEITPNFVSKPARGEFVRAGSNFASAAEARVAEAEGRSRCLSQANAQYLLTTRDDKVSARGIGDVRWQKLRLNRLVFEEISAQRRAAVKEAALQTLLWVGFVAFNVLCRLVTLAYWWPHARNIFRSVSNLLREQARTSRAFAQDTRPDFLMARNLLRARIEKLEDELGPESRRPLKFRRRPRRWRRLGR